MAMMQPKLWSLNSLSVELQRNPRTLAKALRNTVPDGKLGRHDAWLMQTCVAALMKYEAGSDQLSARAATRSNGSRGYAEALIDQIENCAANVEVLMQRLRRARTVGQRREILETDGKVVGELDRAFQAQLAADDAAGIHRPFTERVMQQLLGEIIDLCGLQLGSS